MKEYILIIVIAVFAVTFIAVKLWPQKAQAAQDDYIAVAKSDFGEVSIDPDSVQALKKNGRVYLSVSAEEKYSDEEFLRELRSGENMQNASAEVSLYLFTNDGAYYWIPNRYLIDDEGRVCADLGASETKPTDKNPLLLKIYSAALKVMEDKKRMGEINVK